MLAGPALHELLVHQMGSFGDAEPIAEAALGVLHRRQEASGDTVLSARESGVLALLPTLLSLDEIAEELGISINTVKSHPHDLRQAGRQYLPQARRGARAGAALDSTRARRSAGTPPPCSAGRRGAPCSSPCSPRASPRSGDVRPLPSDDCRGTAGCVRAPAPASHWGRMTARRFEFRVRGSLSDRTRDEFYGLAVADAPRETIIFGEVVDESHLHGILALVRSLDLHLISMHEIELAGRSAEQPTLLRAQHGTSAAARTARRTSRACTPPGDRHRDLQVIGNLRKRATRGHHENQRPIGRPLVAFPGGGVVDVPERPSTCSGSSPHCRAECGEPQPGGPTADQAWRRAVALRRGPRCGSAGMQTSLPA